MEKIYQEPIEWEFDYWTEKKESLAALKGYDKDDIQYEAIGVMASIDEIIEVTDIEVVQKKNVQSK